MQDDLPGMPLSHLCSIRVERQLDTAIARVYGELDLSSEHNFERELRALLDDDIEALVLDMRGLTFMDSTGLRMLVSLNNRARERGIDFAVLCGEGNVRRVLRETGLDGVLPVVGPAGSVPPSESPIH